MPTGPGKYDELCTYVRENSGAKTAIVIVLEGILGSGFSVQSESPGSPRALAQVIRQIADELDRSADP